MTKSKVRVRRSRKGAGPDKPNSNPAAPELPPFNFNPQHGVPIVGVTNGDTVEFAHLGPDGELFFAGAQGTGQDVLIGPGGMNPQDAPKLLGQVAPSMSISYDIVDNNEYDQSLQGKDGMLVFHQMGNDGTINNAMLFILGAMMSKQWKVLPPTDDPAGYEQAQFIKEQFGLDDTGSGKYSFHRLFTVYRHALQYGQAYGEIVLAQGADGKVILDKIVTIHPWAVNNFEFDKQGGPKTLVLGGTVKGTGEQVRDKKVPIYKTITFTHDDDGTFTGKSFLRAAVAHWRVKRSLIVLINQSMERFLLGVPVVKVPKSVREGTKQWYQAQKIAKDYILKPRTGIILSPGWDFEVAKLNVNMPDALPYLEYHDAAIARALGIDFNTIRQAQEGDAKNGGAVGHFMDMTEQTIETLLREFASAVNLFLIPKLILLNWPDARVYPRIAFEQGGKEDFSASANLMGMLINAALGAAKAPTSTSVGPDGKTSQTGGELDVARIPEVLGALMSSLPPRFKRALGVEEMELAANMQKFQTGASTAYKVDGRKPVSMPNGQKPLKQSA